MGTLSKAYAVDKSAAEDGKWQVTAGAVDVKVAKLGCPAFIAEVTRLQKPHLARLRSAAGDNDLHTSITIEAMAKTILLDWKVEQDGKPVPYTWELGVQALTDYAEFKEDISILSATRSNFRPEEISGK